MKCAACEETECAEGVDCTKFTPEIRKKYRGKKLQMMRAAAKIEARYYMKKTRIEELMLFSREMGYKRLGLAFCVGLKKEAEAVAEILSRHFKVYSGCCKICGMDKEDFELEKLHPDREIDVTCNPIGQAEALARRKTDLNVIIGLCLGHDILFTQHSKAPVTTLIVKDRVLAHNPAGAIYSRYYNEERLTLA
jgi:uncharacterized metal-binding protein